jgi:hypothetical protein
LDWIWKEPEDAKKEFQQSAAEIIAILKKIARELQL